MVRSGSPNEGTFRRLVLTTAGKRYFFCILLTTKALCPLSAVGRTPRMPYMPPSRSLSELNSSETAIQESSPDLS